ncbi:hypothetical protein NQ317_015472 [Molorchus minor]|uniref:Uncharacterized protein n=1 Tax=Molorchus minor TaxID=1323400 RepID=A0ABQ9J9N2_9CUCU|nr:hypothetical protein NQ317_015472 [Molorchus minor]
MGNISKTTGLNANIFIKCQSIRNKNEELRKQMNDIEYLMQHSQNAGENRTEHQRTKFGRFLPRGKLNRPAPTLVSVNHMTAVEIILKYREADGVHPDNKVPSIHIFKADQALKQFCVANNLSDTKFTATKLKKHLATVTSTHLTGEQQLISDFMEHHINIHNTHYSMLRSTLNINHDISIQNYAKLRALLKRKSQGFRPKKATTFTPENINKFLTDASDEKYLATKVALIVGIMGACRANEPYFMKLEHLTVPHTKTKITRKFTITDKFYQICKKYINLRPTNFVSNIYFLNYQNGKCTKQRIGVNKFTVMGNCNVMIRLTKVAKILFQLKIIDLQTGIRLSWDPPLKNWFKVSKILGVKDQFIEIGTFSLSFENSNTYEKVPISINWSLTSLQK